MAELYGKSTVPLTDLVDLCISFQKNTDFMVAMVLLVDKSHWVQVWPLEINILTEGPSHFALWAMELLGKDLFKETLNLAMLWDLPVVFIVENNGYAMGTSVKRTSNHTDIWKLGLGYEMPCGPVDGMNPVKVAEALDEAPPELDLAMDLHCWK